MEKEAQTFIWHRLVSNCEEIQIDSPFELIFLSLELFAINQEVIKQDDLDFFDFFFLRDKVLLAIFFFLVVVFLSRFCLPKVCIFSSPPLR